MNHRYGWGRISGGYARRVARWFARRPFSIRAGRPVISFTFDDFPRSALHEAGALLEASGLAGTFFVSCGLMGQTTPTGEMFIADDLPLLLTRGHEFGCHTFHHHSAWTTAPSKYELSVVDNARALARIMGGMPLQTHSYPISYPRPDTKRRLSKRFRACRGGGQTHNQAAVDLNYLSSFFLEQSRDDFDTVERAIADNANDGGWLIFSTHDVCSAPTRFGCTPDFFARVLRASISSGAMIQGVAATLDTIGVHPLPFSRCDATNNV